MNSGGDIHLGPGTVRPTQEQTAAAASAVVRMLDGGLIPEAEEQSPLRRVQLATIWLAEAQRELDDAIIEAYRAGVKSREIGAVWGVSGAAVRVRIQKLREDGRLV